jgi:D-alanyl-D-alanine carboxypeptidase/D-alanyl-D-alanine-endopeptidase (penicillin-binding protein 4)
VWWDAADTTDVDTAGAAGGTPVTTRGPMCVPANTRRGPDGCRPSQALVTALESPPLAELVGGVLEPSQNWMAEQMVNTLGAELGGHGSFVEGLDVVRRFVDDVAGVDPLDVRPRDGSGLSAYNLVTPRALVAVLRQMLARPDGSAYRDAMAEPGEEDSTLEERLTGLEGRVFAKTGSISNVNSLSGYLVREDGRPVAFSILTNAGGVGAGQVRAAIDDIVRILAR